MAEFTCAMCGDVFEEGRTKEETEAEMLADFGNVPEEDQAVICDTCYQKVDPKKPKNKQYIDRYHKENPE